MASHTQTVASDHALPTLVHQAVEKKVDEEIQTTKQEDDGEKGEKEKPTEESSVTELQDLPDDKNTEPPVVAEVEKVKDVPAEVDKKDADVSVSEPEASSTLDSTVEKQVVLAKPVSEAVDEQVAELKLAVEAVKEVEEETPAAEAVKEVAEETPSVEAVQKLPDEKPATEEVENLSEEKLSKETKEKLPEEPAIEAVGNLPTKETNDNLPEEPTIEAVKDVKQEKPEVEAVENLPEEKPTKETNVNLPEEPAIVEIKDVKEEKPAAEAVENPEETPTIEKVEKMQEEPAIEAVKDVKEEKSAVETVENLPEKPAIEAVEHVKEETSTIEKIENETVEEKLATETKENEPVQEKIEEKEKIENVEPISSNEAVGKPVEVSSPKQPEEVSKVEFKAEEKAEIIDEVEDKPEEQSKVIAEEIAEKIEAKLEENLEGGGTNANAVQEPAAIESSLSNNEEAQADLKEVAKDSLVSNVEKIVAGDKNGESSAVDVAKGLLKNETTVTEKVEEVIKEEKTEEKNMKNEEPIQSERSKDEGVSGAGIVAEVVERSLGAEQVIPRDVEVDKGKVEENLPTSVEPSNDKDVVEKVNATEPVGDLKEPQLNVNAEDTNKADAKLESTKEAIDDKPITKEVDDSKTSRDLPVQEVSVKPAQKSSGNIMSKVKQSIVKVKKAIIGKSPNSKSLQPEAKGDEKAN
ncbi:hypothetical protein EZV62_000102 [Acer yangbiense]|uniref:Uncharacterized protein n=1 Tax=Acer yangbiense TaxID=1000413 RepID=A0A5C7IQ56_9ROSI|nr:hypothetical protein EZV62_000102 [Acer yangbiense]